MVQAINAGETGGFIADTELISHLTHFSCFGNWFPVLIGISLIYDLAISRIWMISSLPLPAKICGNMARAASKKPH
jgi:hypothetical protein